MKKVTEFLKKNPEVLTAYVTVGYNLANKAIAPLNKFMKHLVEVQGIDPRTQPGETTRKILAKVMSKVEDKEDFEPGFQISQKGFEKVNAQLNHLNLDQDAYKALTDLSRLSDPEQLEHEAKTQTWKFVNYPVEEYRQDVERREVADQTKKNFKAWRASGDLSTESLQKALETLKKYAEKYSTPASKADAAEKAQEQFQKGLFKRVENYNDEE